jgi:hypothetical protein
MEFRYVTIAAVASNAGTAIECGAACRGALAVAEPIVGSGGFNVGVTQEPARLLSSSKRILNRPHPDKQPPLRSIRPLLE